MLKTRNKIKFVVKKWQVYKNIRKVVFDLNLSSHHHFSSFIHNKNNQYLQENSLNKSVDKNIKHSQKRSPKGWNPFFCLLMIRNILLNTFPKYKSSRSTNTRRKNEYKSEIELIFIYFVTYHHIIYHTHTSSNDLCQVKFFIYDVMIVSIL